MSPPVRCFRVRWGGGKSAHLKCFLNTVTKKLCILKEVPVRLKINETHSITYKIICYFLANTSIIKRDIKGGSLLAKWETVMRRKHMSILMRTRYYQLSNLVPIILRPTLLIIIFDCDGRRTDNTWNTVQNHNNQRQLRCSSQYGLYQTCKMPSPVVLYDEYCRSLVQCIVKVV